ncbi:MAG: hypothetical protein R3B06_10230 [Kofleriaceae bacterium]
MFDRLWFVAPGALLVACVTPPPPPATPAPTAEARCYRGDVSVHAGPDDAEVARMPTVVRRTTDPTAGTIVEEVTQRGDAGVETYVVTMTVDGKAFAMAERSGAFTGAGALTGEPWRWDQWTSTSTLPDGSTVTSTDRRTISGLTATKVVTRDGAAVATLHEDYQAFACDGYDAALAALR